MSPMKRAVILTLALIGAGVALWRYVFRDVDWDALDGLVDGRP